MKISRNILRKMELKIYQAVTMEEMRKSSHADAQPKLGPEKVPSEKSDDAK